MIERGATKQVALVVHPNVTGEPGPVSADRLEEAVGLAEALDLEVVVREEAVLRAVTPATFFGSGKVEELGAAARAHEANVIVVDAAVTPVQQRNLERAWSLKVLDRTGLILEIFARRARTKEGRLQVELARLGYERSRLVRTWTHLERQRGGQGVMGGPGETQIEADRRVIRDKIAKLRRELEEVRRTRGLHRAKRKRAPFPMVALVGYTNAGKSSLFNALTNAKVLAKDMLFATLDPTLRGLALPSGGEAMLADTVGFISDLPPDLVEAFKATLEEVAEADLLLHVRDIAHPQTESQRQDVIGILNRLGAGEEADQRLIEVWNKADLLDEEDHATLAMTARGPRDHGEGDHAPSRVLVSARSGEGLETLIAAIDTVVNEGAELYQAVVPATEGRALAWLHAHGQVLSETTDEAGTTVARVRLSALASGRYGQAFGALAPARRVEGEAPRAAATSWSPLDSDDEA